MSREVGILMSLGATPTAVVRLLMGGGMKLVGIGAAIGLLLAVAFARLMSGLLYGVNATDPWAFGIVPVVLLSVAALAAWVPARRATAVNPVRALKAE